GRVALLGGGGDDEEHAGLADGRERSHRLGGREVAGQAPSVGHDVVVAVEDLLAVRPELEGALGVADDGGALGGRPAAGEGCGGGARGAEVDSGAVAEAPPALGGSHV